MIQFTSQEIFNSVIYSLLYGVFFALFISLLSSVDKILSKIINIPKVCLKASHNINALKKLFTEKSDEKKINIGFTAYVMDFFCVLFFFVGLTILNYIVLDCIFRLYVFIISVAASYFSYKTFISRLVRPLEFLLSICFTVFTAVIAYIILIVRIIIRRTVIFFQKNKNK